MEYIFRNKNYKVSKFKTYLTNQLKKDSIENVNTHLTEFIDNNNLEMRDLISILNRYIDYSLQLEKNNIETKNYIDSKIKLYPEKINNEFLISIANLYRQIDIDYSLSFIESEQNKLENNTKQKIQFLLLKTDLLIEKKEFNTAFSTLRDCSNQSYNLYIFDSLELKRTIFEKMSIIGELENKSDVALNYYIYYSAFQASCEFLHFPYLDSYKNFRMVYTILEDPNQEIVKLEHHLMNQKINIEVFDKFLQEIYKYEIPKAFKLDNIDINNFSVSNSPIKELTYYSNYINSIEVSELVSNIEFLTSQKIKNYG